MKLLSSMIVTIIPISLDPLDRYHSPYSIRAARVKTILPANPNMIENAMTFRKLRF
jgi:hypothetical protein